MILADYRKLLENIPPAPKLIGRQDSAAVLAPFVEFEGRMHLLFEKRAAGIPQGGEICFPGGRPDPEDKNLVETAVRETCEELGVGEDRVLIDGLLGTIAGGPGMVDVYAGRILADDRDDFSINPDEVSHLIFVPFRWFLENKPEAYLLETEHIPVPGPEGKIFPAEALGLPEKYHGTWRGRPHFIYAYRYEDEVIWGLTARMIREFVKIYESK